MQGRWSNAILLYLIKAYPGLLNTTPPLSLGSTREGWMPGTTTLESPPPIDVSILGVRL